MDDTPTVFRVGMLRNYDTQRNSHVENLSSYHFAVPGYVVGR